MIYRIFIINLLDVVFILYIYCVNLENLNNGNYCVMLMLCFRIACIHVLPVKAIPEPSLEVVCLHASFLDGFRSGFKTEFICQKSKR